MNHPDQLSQSYAAILPALKDLGYRADVKANIDDERFIVTVGGKPTVRVYSDGGWKRDDGPERNNPGELLRFYRHEHYLEALKHWETRNWRGIARDLLIDSGIRMGAVLSAEPSGSHLDVEYRPFSGPAETIRFNRVQAKTVNMLKRLEKDSRIPDLEAAA